MFLTPASRAGRKRVGATVVTAPLALNFGTLTTNPGEPTPGMGLTVYGTWNGAGVNFDAPIFMSITATAAGGGSNLLDLQQSGAVGTGSFVVESLSNTGLDLFTWTSGTTNFMGFQLHNTTTDYWNVEIGGSAADSPHCMIFYDNFPGRRALLLNGQHGAMTGSNLTYSWSNLSSPQVATDDTGLARGGVGVILTKGSSNVGTTGNLTTTVWQQTHDSYGAI